MEVDAMASTARPLKPHLRLHNSFASNCFSARRQQIKSLQMFRSRELTGHFGAIYSMEFSDDGTFLVSGGDDKTVLVWSLDQGGWISTEMKAKHENEVMCLAISPDNRRIFSGGYDKKVLVHDTNTFVAVSFRLVYFSWSFHFILITGRNC